VKYIGAAEVTKAGLLEVWFIPSRTLRILFRQYSVKEFDCFCKILKLFLLLSFVFEDLSRVDGVRDALMD
jgi:hypothetical protein